uniref:Uncharacterized protein n=1 Tax=Candidatus Kentrum sp. LPFa TaxID=2126335 RepID=A0A450WBY0_9GAMM|nr:MAG: hypothetical protein BECKLPF1236A_GA0070988_101088 [Candidatus Kentron sp. LPFa]VFK29696.1 MAG: hypothetical protein BECKLPF1236C_GA0070990_100928 [Candidatus Kentron sp. LPFa]
MHHQNQMRQVFDFENPGELPSFLGSALPSQGWLVQKSSHLYFLLVDNDTTQGMTERIRDANIHEFPE